MGRIEENTIMCISKFDVGVSSSMTASLMLVDRAVMRWWACINDCHVRIFKYTVFSSGSFCQIYRVTDEALIAKTAVWPNFFLMNVFFALK